MLEQLPETNDLIAKILEEGPLYIEYNQHLSKRFDGYWSPHKRTIYITPSANHPLSTLLFEMHNALKSNEFCKLDHLAHTGVISRKDYIEHQEYLEYQNALETFALLEEGVERGFFLPDSGWYPSETFEKHFRIQKKTGHSAWIGKAYDQVKG